MSPNVNLFSYTGQKPNECLKFDINNLTTDKTNLILINNNPLHIEYFAKIVLPYIRYKFVIVTSCCDSTFPVEMNGWSLKEQQLRGNNLDNIINNPYFVHWFAINKIIPDNTIFTSIPYGLDYWTLEHLPYWDSPIMSRIEQDRILYNIVKQSSHFSKRIPKIYANWHMNLTDTRFGGMRSKLQTIIPPNIIYYAQNQSRSDYWVECSKYAFVVSPFGNGLDCIRTWEALSLGCIVIVKTSPLDNLYTDLPVAIIREWTDINEQLLNSILLDFSNKTFNVEKLTMKYWLEKVKSKL